MKIKQNNSLKITMFIIFWTLMTLNFNSCEPQTVDVELPYIEELVINANFSAGSSAKNISITRTLPPLSDDGDEDKVYIQNVDAKIISEGKEWQLIPNTDPYNPTFQNLDLIFEAGKSYKFEVSWKELFVWAEVLVPDKPEVLGYSFNQTSTNSNYYEIFLISNKNDKNYIYLTSTNSKYDPEDTTNSRKFRYYYYNNDYFHKNNVRYNNLGNLKFDTQNLTDEIFKEEIPKKNFFAGLIKIDKIYELYEETYPSRGGEFFGTGYDNTVSNIKGDGFGLVIGTSESVVSFDTLKYYPY